MTPGLQENTSLRANPLPIETRTPLRRRLQILRFHPNPKMQRNRRVRLKKSALLKKSYARQKRQPRTWSPLSVKNATVFSTVPAQ